MSDTTMTLFELVTQTFDDKNIADAHEQIIQLCRALNAKDGFTVRYNLLGTGDRQGDRVPLHVELHWNKHGVGSGITTFKQHLTQKGPDEIHFSNMNSGGFQLAWPHELLTAKVNWPPSTTP